MPGSFRGDGVAIGGKGLSNHTTRARVHSVTRAQLLLGMCRCGTQPKKPGKWARTAPFPCPLLLQQGTVWPRSAGWVFSRPIESPAEPHQQRDCLSLLKAGTGQFTRVPWAFLIPDYWLVDLWHRLLSSCVKVKNWLGSSRRNSGTWFFLGWKLKVLSYHATAV